MDIRQLRYFIAIAEERKITAAAKRLHIAQPPLSQQLKSMEQELGVQLILRNGKYLELTEAGQALYKHAVTITNLLEESQIEVKEMGSGTRGKLTIGVNTLSFGPLPELLQAFQKQYPNLAYKIQQNESAQLCKLVRERVIELAIIRFPLELNDFSILHLYTEPFYFITTARGETDIHSPRITYDQIHRHPLILPSTEGLGVYNMILEQFSRHRLKANIICECSDIATLLQLVSSGFGAGIVPKSVLKLHPGYRLQAYEIEDDKFVSSSGLIWLKNHYLSKAAQNFIELASAQKFGANDSE